MSVYEILKLMIAFAKLIFNITKDAKKPANPSQVKNKRHS